MAYAIECLIWLLNLEGSPTPLRPPRLAIGTAIPREVGGPISGTAAIRRGSVTMKKVEEKYMLERTGRV